MSDWILTSEREAPDDGKFRMVQNKGGEIFPAYRTCTGGGWYGAGAQKCHDIIAWQPLPAPYKPPKEWTYEYHAVRNEYQIFYCNNPMGFISKCDIAREYCDWKNGGGHE